MKSAARDFFVGLFVIVAIASLCFLALRVSGLVGAVTGGNSYTLNAHFDNIAGLTPKAKVTMSGVTIGQVTEIRLDTKRLDALVVMEIDRQYNMIDEEATASILTSGLLGEKYIGITPSSGEKMLKNGDTFNNTVGALVLEDLIGKFFSGKMQEAPKPEAATSGF